MAEALFNELARERRLAVRAMSAGTACGTNINPVAVESMAELDISMEGQAPKTLTQEMADRADRIITMGCGVDAEECPARFLVSEDWGLDDPNGKPPEEVARIRDEIRQRVERLLDDLAQCA